MHIAAGNATTGRESFRIMCMLCDQTKYYDDVEINDMIMLWWVYTNVTYEGFRHLVHNGTTRQWCIMLHNYKHNLLLDDIRRSNGVLRFESSSSAYTPRRRLSLSIWYRFFNIMRCANSVIYLFIYWHLSSTHCVQVNTQKCCTAHVESLRYRGRLCSHKP